MDRSLPCIDGLAVTYLLFTAGLLLLGWGSGWVYQTGVVIHIGTAIGIIVLGWAPSLPPVLKGLRETYPILLLLLFYAEVDLYVKLLHEPPGYDGLVQSWDAFLFGGHPHVYLSQFLSGWGWSELFHFFYLSYYVLLVCSFFYVWSRRPPEFPRFSFVVTGMFASFMLIFMAFPVAGPLAEPSMSLNTSGIFPRLVSWIYAPLRMNGIWTGAFPSSHVGMSVGIVCMIRSQDPWTRLLQWTLVGGIAVSTAYGGFHYAIDAVAGGITGWGLYHLWSWFFTRVREFITSTVETPDERRVSAPSAPDL